MIQGLLGQAGIPHNLCSDLTDLCQQLHVGTGAVLLMEQSLSHPKAMCLAEHLRQQPEWSEVPVLVLTERLSPWEFPTWANDILASATLLAHPVHPATLLQRRPHGTGQPPAPVRTAGLPRTART